VILGIVWEKIKEKIISLKRLKFDQKETNSLKRECMETKTCDTENAEERAQPRYRKS
jgi:hypothetical protein